MKTLILLFISGIFSLFGGIFGLKKILPTFATVALATALAYLLYDSTYGDFNLQNMLVFNAYSNIFMGIAIGSSLLISLMAAKGFSYNDDSIGDLLGLMFFVLCGVMCMVSFNNMVMLFLGIEILSIPLYVMVGSNRNNKNSNEAALKYFIMGAFTTGFLLFGMALIYGATRSFDLEVIRSLTVTVLANNSSMVSIGLLFITVAFAFKIAAVPFHFWSPDVYQGSPTLVTGFMATVVKTAGLGAFLKFVIALSPLLGNDWYLIISIMACATMLGANIIAVKQDDFKRMMAYSSVSHVGYVLMAILTVNQETTSVVAFYLITYSLATLGIFGCLMLINPSHNKGNGFELFNGLGKKSPYIALVLTLCLLSLAGIPPFPGFFAKFSIFKQAISEHFWLVIVAICSSAISIYYYFRAITAMYFGKTDEVTLVESETNYSGLAVISIAVIGLVVLGIFPQMISF
jgi:NADH-quinone oxidoreductase subunit N